MEAESTSDAESRSKLLSAAKLLADATTKMVDVAKVFGLKFTIFIITEFFLQF